LDTSDPDAAANRLLTITAPGDGNWTFPGTLFKPVNFTSIERFNHVEILVEGADATAAGQPRVRSYDAENFLPKLNFLAYEAGFKGGVRVATGDMNGDGIPDIVTVPGPGRTVDARIFDGLTGGMIGTVQAYDASYKLGAFVAVAEVTGDLRNDIIVGPGLFSSEVRVFSGATLGLVHKFTAYEANSIGGVSVAAGDFNGDGRAEVVTAPGAGVNIRVRVWNVNVVGLPVMVLPEIVAFGSEVGNVSLAVGRFNGDATPEIFVGAGQRGGGGIKIYNGATGGLINQFNAFPHNSAIRVVVKDHDANGVIDEIFAAQGTDRPTAQLRVFNLGLAAVDMLLETSPDLIPGVFLG
jgi:hypothetical protein